MRLNDALRGAADHAPVEGLTVSAADASRRISRRRALRTGSNGVVAVGAVAILGVGLMGPSFAAGSADDADMAAADAAGGAREGAAPESMADGGAALGYGADDSAGDSMLAEQWMCGSDFSDDDPAWAYGDPSGAELTASSPEATDGGYEIERVLTASRPVDLISGGDYVVTWDGIVVGRYVEPSPIVYGPADEPSLPAGEVYERLDPATELSSLQSWQTVDAVNCWDGTALPAGDYEVHLAQTLAYPADVSTDVPTASPSPTAMSTDVPIEQGAEASVAPMPEVFRVAAEPVELTVPGERVDDPFGAYLGTAEPEPLPEPTLTIEPGPDTPGTPDEPSLPQPPAPLGTDVLTPDAVRGMYQASATTDAWDMAAGTHRWLMNGPNSATYVAYGCGWDGANATFPKAGSTMDLLDLSVNAPSSVAVSYGFVVDGNPEVTASVTNISDYAVAEFWGTQPQLYLVKDGRVVAEGYPTSLDRDGGMRIMPWGNEGGAAVDGGVATGGAAPLIAPAPRNGMLEPGATVAGTYLWRDVNRCDGSAAGVEPGDYTLLASTTLYVSAYSAMDATEGSAAFQAPDAKPLVPEPRTLADDADDVVVDGGTSGSSSDMAVAPVNDDWVDLQLWTSLGSMSVR